MRKQTFRTRTKYERKLDWVNSKFQRLMCEIDDEPVTALKATRDILRSVLKLLIESDGYLPKRNDICALWASAHRWQRTADVFV
ncbi:MAG: hypothetical protein JWM97_1816 [Phycisphaerales bacterium]|nr:hypothetical protein [Phycisphaerales bacterium]